MSTTTDEYITKQSGGGSNVEYLSYTQWNELTPAQRKEKDYVMLGNPIGEYTLINGKETVDFGEYIPYSTKANIICDAHTKNFDHDDLNNRWGYGSSPVQFGTLDRTTKSWYNYDQTEDAIFIGGYSAGQTSRLIARVDLGYPLIPSGAFTAYLICKVDSTAKPSYPIPMGCYYGSGNWGGSALFIQYHTNNNVYISNGGNGPISIITNLNWNDYMGFCLQYDSSSKMGKCCLMSPTIELTSMYNAQGTTNYLDSFVALCSCIGQYMSGSTAVDANYRCNLFVKYFGIINTLESLETVQNNMANLKQKFLISE